MCVIIIMIIIRGIKFGQLAFLMDLESREDEGTEPQPRGSE
jgi:hypothetical protein